MTVIAYRDGVMAGDRMGTDDRDLIVGYRTKVVAFDGMIWGTTGHTQDGLAFAEWVKGGRNANKPDLHESFTALFVERGGILMRYNSKLYPIPAENPYHAIGAGDQVAMGAMYMGATAEEAVKAACVHVIGCGGGVDVLRLDTPPALTPVHPAQMAQ